MGALPERGVRERVQRLVQLPKLVDHWCEVVAGVEAPVQLAHLRRQLVETLEQRVELTVSYLLAIHDHDCRSSTPATTPAASIATSRNAACRPGTKCWWSSSLAA